MLATVLCVLAASLVKAEIGEEYLKGPPPGAKIIKLPVLDIDPMGVRSAGCSHAADFAHQFHIAYSKNVKGACIFSGQPYHCAVTRFAQDVQVVQTPESSVPNCDGCDENKTLVYDHCKNHPEWVDNGQLPDYVRRGCGQNPIKYTECIDDPVNLFDARVFLFRPTHDRCYLKGAVANVADLYAQLVTNPAEQVKFINDQPFPHSLPTNSTPFFNHSDPSGYDGPGHCLRHVYDNMTWAGVANPENCYIFDQTEFFDDDTNGTGVNSMGNIYIPEACAIDEATGKPRHQCKMMMLTNGCGGTPWMGGSDWDFAAYAESNNIVLLKMCVGGYVDKERFPHALEVQRGLTDVYGQLGEDYSMQRAPHMKIAGRVMKRVMGLY